MKRLAWLCVLLFVLPVSAQTTEPKPRPQPIAGLSAERLARIAPAMGQLLKDGKFPGMSVAVAKDGKVVYQQEFGFADIEKNVRLKKDAIYRVYSMSKPVTGVAMMILLEEGRYQLDDPVSKYIPCFKDVEVFEGDAGGEMKLAKTAREVTIRDLLRQTSGFSYGGGANAVGKMYQSKNLLDPKSTLDQMAEKACTIPLLFQPGTRWEYGVSIDLLGRLVEILSGQPLDVFMQKRIFDPLKMVDTGFSVPEAKMPRFTTCYSYAPGKPLSPIPATRGVDAYRPGANRLLSGGGGLVSTTSDYLRFAMMLAGGGALDGMRILGPKTIGLMAIDQLPDGVKPASWGGKNDGNGYGFTMSVTTDLSKATGYGSVGDFGWDGAASTFFRVDPKEHLVVLVMTQRQPTDLEIQVKVKALVYQALVGE